jgi:alpha-D-xyloside xylohydrolase
MLSRAHDRGLHTCVWINPYIAQSSYLFEEGVSNGYLLMRSDGKGVWQSDHWQAGMGIVDFTNPDAWTWFQSKHKVLLDQGVDSLKTDFGERIPLDVTYHDGSDPASMHNYYSYLYNKCVFELLERERGHGDAVLFARSATAGGQQFPVHWGGDCMASYPSMAETLRGGLSLSMCGFGFWSHDISGFEATATPDLYKRWAQFGLLSSHSRLHGSGSYRVPWVFDEESVDVVRDFAQLKCRLMPYVFDMAVHAHETGVPVMRPMVLEFQDDPACRYLDMQYMLGDSLLVAPVFSADGSASYYLPEGTWTDWFTGETREGGRWYEGTYDYLHLPLYVRPNALVAVGSHDDRPDYDYADGLTLRWYAPDPDVPATCRIVDETGSVLATATATMTEGKASLELSRPLPGVTLEVMSSAAKEA